jgi:hypothetical protein
MAWDWIEKGTKRLQELGGEYKQHHALVERLLVRDPAAARDELTRAWLAMDSRARAGMKMTLAGLALSQQTASSSAESKLRLERLKALQTVVEQASQGAPPAAAASTEATLTAGAARVTSKLADVAERARPRAGQLIESARKGIEQHGPAVEAAVKSVISELLKADAPAASGPSRSEPAGPAREPVVPPPIPEDRPRPSAADGTTPIVGQWAGTLRGSASADTVDCDLKVAASGRPVWAFHDTNGFQHRELTHTGQRLQYVPPGGGVVTVTVQSVTGSSTETGYIVDYSFEGSSNGYLTQKYQRFVLAGRLHGSQLDVTYSEAGLSSFGDKTGLAAGSDAREYRGWLTKQA